MGQSRDAIVGCFLRKTLHSNVERVFRVERYRDLVRLDEVKRAAAEKESHGEDGNKGSRLQRVVS